MTRPAFGGNTIATIACPATVLRWLLYVQVIECRRSLRSAGAKANVVEYNPGFTQNDRYVEILNIVKAVKSTANIMEAKILVSGIVVLVPKRTSNFWKILQEVLGGTVSCSRAVVENGWLPVDLQVVRLVKLFVLRSTLQSVFRSNPARSWWLEDSDLIIAINKDEDAPIFDVADYGLVGDLNKIVPALTTALKAELGK